VYHLRNPSESFEVSIRYCGVCVSIILRRTTVFVVMSEFSMCIDQLRELHYHGPNFQAYTNTSVPPRAIHTNLGRINEQLRRLIFSIVTAACVTHIKGFKGPREHKVSG
jgi:hypothetical protein